jgi:hypothetical protein
MNTGNPTSVLADDYLALERICTELETDQGSPEHRKEMADHLIAQFTPHAEAEARYLTGGNLAEIEQVMRRLKDTGPAEPRFEGLLSTLIHAVRRHVHERLAPERVRVELNRPVQRHSGDLPAE